MASLVCLVHVLICCRTSASWTSPASDATLLPSATSDIIAGNTTLTNSSLDSIILIGGFYSDKMLALYGVSNEEIYYSSTSYFPSSRQIHGVHTSTQIGSTIYIYDVWNSSFILFDVDVHSISYDFEMMTFDGSYYTPDHLYSDSCITSYDEALIVLGGVEFTAPDTISTGSSQVSIYNTSNEQWSTGTDIGWEIYQSSCLVEPESSYLYAIYDRYIYRILAPEVLANSGSWNRLSNKLSDDLYKATSVAHGGYVYVIGGTADYGFSAGNGDVYRIDYSGNVEEMSSMQLPYGLYDTTCITVKDAIYCFGGVTDNDNQLDDWLIWDFSNETTTPSPTSDGGDSATSTTSTATTAITSTETVNTETVKTTESGNSTSSASSINETPKGIVLGVAVGMGVWIFCIMLCLFLQCSGVGHWMQKTSTAEQTMASIQEETVAPVPSSSVRDEQPTNNTKRITLDPQPTVDMEGAEGNATGSGHRMTMMSAIVDAEHQKIESWIQKRKRMDKEAVRDWLEGAGYGHYADTFIENEVEQLSIVKVMGHDELVQIGIVNQQDLSGLLAAIRKLR